jgi:hypothetical protein
MSRQWMIKEPTLLEASEAIRRPPFTLRRSRLQRKRGVGFDLVHRLLGAGEAGSEGFTLLRLVGRWPDAGAFTAMLNNGEVAPNKIPS